MGCPSLAGKILLTCLVSGLRAAACPSLFRHWYWRLHEVTVKHCPYAAWSIACLLSAWFRARIDPVITIRQLAAVTSARALACMAMAALRHLNCFQAPNGLLLKLWMQYAWLLVQDISPSLMRGNPFKVGVSRPPWG